MKPLISGGVNEKCVKFCVFSEQIHRMHHKKLAVEFEQNRMSPSRALLVIRSLQARCGPGAPAGGCLNLFFEEHVSDGAKHVILLPRTRADATHVEPGLDDTRRAMLEALEIVARVA